MRPSNSRTLSRVDTSPSRRPCSSTSVDPEGDGVGRSLVTIVPVSRVSNSYVRNVSLSSMTELEKDRHTCTCSNKLRKLGIKGVIDPPLISWIECPVPLLSYVVVYSVQLVSRTVSCIITIIMKKKKVPNKSLEYFDDRISCPQKDNRRSSLCSPPPV